MVLLKEEYIVKMVIDFLENKEDGNWHSDKTQKSKLHGKGADIFMVGGKRDSERFYIECKGKSYAKNANIINKEGWVNALGQIITRMNVKKYSNKKGTAGIKDINRAYKYGLGLYWKSAQVALRRIPKSIAQVLNLYIFSVNEKGLVKQFTPSQFGKEYLEDSFKA